VGRADLLEVAADFHRDAAVGWLFRDASELEKQTFAEYALEQKLADALVVAFRIGLRVWSWRAREQAAAWHVTAGLAYSEAPEELPIEGGWVMASDGNVTSLPASDGDWVLERRFDRGNVVAVTLPWGVRRLGEEAMKGCCCVTQVTVPPGLEEIGKAALAMCQSLTRFDLPPGVASIEDGAFWWCRGLRRMVVPSGVTKLGKSAFCGCSGLLRLQLPDGLREIGDWGISHCSRLKELGIPSTVRTIGACGFEGCTGLTKVAIPRSMTKIGKFAFARCYALTELEIPANLTELGKPLFPVGVEGGWRELTRLVLLGSPLSPELIEALEQFLAEDACVVGAELAGQSFGSFVITAE
jgi:hypothetical protein